MPTITLDTYRQQGKKWVIDADPDSQLDYAFDWTKYLNLVNDTILSVEFVADPLLTKVAQGHDDTHATAWIKPSALATGQLPLTCRITTNSTPPRIDDRTVFLNIVSK